MVVRALRLPLGWPSSLPLESSLLAVLLYGALCLRSECFAFPESPRFTHVADILLDEGNSGLS